MSVSYLRGWGLCGRPTNGRREVSWAAGKERFGATLSYVFYNVHKILRKYTSKSNEIFLTAYQDPEKTLALGQIILQDSVPVNATRFGNLHTVRMQSTSASFLISCFVNLNRREDYSYNMCFS